MTRTSKPQTTAAFEVLADSVPEAAKSPRKPSRVRQPVKPVTKSPEAVAKNAASDRARKAESKKALKSALKPEVVSAPKPVPAPKSPDKKAAEHEAYLAALRVDADALGVDPDAYIKEQLDVPKAGYSGPMLALRRAALTYIKAHNGRPCCGDELATVCGQYSREVVVVGLIAALGLPSNPYTHLNPGQQSMNLRNKVRAAIKSGLVQMSAIQAALTQAA